VVFKEPSKYLNILCFNVWDLIELGGSDMKCDETIPN
jgi:hypothetical protein